MQTIHHNMRISPIEIVDRIRVDYHYNISYTKAHRAKWKAMERIFGNWEQSYEQLLFFLDALRRTNLGTILLEEDSQIAWQHQFCMRHLIDNFKKKYKSKELSDMVWRAATIKCTSQLAKEMRKILTVNPAAREWVDQVPPQMWALCYDGGYRYGIMTTNKYEKYAECQSNVPMLFHYPCAHVKAACGYARIAPGMYVSECFYADSFRGTYAPVFHAVDDASRWPAPIENDPIFVPPQIKRPAGRPKSVRRRMHMDNNDDLPKNKCSKYFDEAGRYSWGSAALAHLYRALSRGCLINQRETAGFFSLLQIWSWERLHVGRPSLPSIKFGLGDRPLGARWAVKKHFDESPSHVLMYCRAQLDYQHETQILWMPYVDRYQEVPPTCMANFNLWTVRVPLICFDIVEMHYPDRVVGQFGCEQTIPVDVERINRGNRSGRQKVNWVVLHKDYIDRWNA
ncbi:hypothetical protein QJS04_geneDACA010445 [Acorus gramineus]|uniref:Aminotransferase-like plant mobile domain-containing protein n=1 Tax=Acorus gramineus TaxID=55184 RepID=A0AAV9A2C7_ACOGR|nr:hypothetical protein QJS04_geneDACA010445 [Acorus gramineus]